MNVILAVIGVIAVLIVLAAAMYVRRLVGCLVNVGMIVVGALLLLLAIFSGPLGLFDDVETVDRLRKKFGLEEQQGDEQQAPARDPGTEKSVDPAPAPRDDGDVEVPAMPTFEKVPGVD